MLEFMLESLFEYLLQYLISCLRSGAIRQTSPGDTQRPVPPPRQSAEERLNAFTRRKDVRDDVLRIQVRYMNGRAKKVNCHNLTVKRSMVVEDIKKKLLEQLGKTWLDAHLSHVSP